MGWIVVRYLGVLATYVTKHFWLCNCESSTRFWSFQSIWFREIFDCHRKMLPFRCSACTVLKKEATRSVKHKWLQHECWPYSTHLRSWRPHQDWNPQPFPLKNSCQASPVRTEGWSNRPVTEASWITRIHAGFDQWSIDNGKTASYQRPKANQLFICYEYEQTKLFSKIQIPKLGVFLHLESCI